VNEYVIKYIGAGVLLISAVLYGYTMIRRERVKVVEISSFCELIKFIRDNIKYKMVTLPVIFSEYHGAYFEKIGFIEAIRNFGIKRAWAEFSWVMEKDEIALIDSFVKNIGSGYRDDEIQLCEYTLERLEDAIESKSSDLKNKEKIYRTIPLMLALSVMLIIL